MIDTVQSSDVVDLLSLLDGVGIHYWVDGGWGVDCLLGEQTRSHSDLDLVVPRRELERVSVVLVSTGYAVLRDWLPTTLAFRDKQGREVDLHPVDPTDDGGGDQVLLDGDSRWHYAPPVEGSVDGKAVRCSSPEDQMLMHLGYEPRAVDIADVHRLAERFGLQVPAPLLARVGGAD